MAGDSDRPPEDVEGDGVAGGGSVPGVVGPCSNRLHGTGKASRVARPLAWGVPRVRVG